MFIALMVSASIMISAIAEQLQERIKSHKSYRNSTHCKSSDRLQPRPTTAGRSFHTHWKPLLTQFLPLSIYIGAILSTLSMPMLILAGIGGALLSTMQPSVNLAIAHLNLLAFGITALSLLAWGSAVFSYLPLLVATGLFLVMLAVVLLAALALLMGLGAALTAARPEATSLEASPLRPYPTRFLLALLAVAGSGVGYWLATAFHGLGQR